MPERRQTCGETIDQFARGDEIRQQQGAACMPGPVGCQSATFDTAYELLGRRARGHNDEAIPGVERRAFDTECDERFPERGEIRRAKQSGTARGNTG
jgi:hypothetical protein